MKKLKTKILIVEDEPIIASDIEMILEDLEYEVTGIAISAEEAIEGIDRNKPDLVLLDINIEGDIDGVMLAEDINRKYKIPFVFLTSNADKMTINRVKRTKPAGFVTKPFSEKDLQSNIEIALFSSKPKVDNNDKVTSFFVKEGSSLIKIDVDKLMLAKADDNYTKIYTVDGSHLLSSTLKKIEDKLPTDKFVRTHRSYVVNVNFIDKIEDGYLFIDTHRLPIGRSYNEDLFKKISKL